MPLFEQSKTPRGRLRVFARAQLPFALGTAVVAIGLDIVAPRVVTSPLLVMAWAMVVIATLAALLVPWEKLPPFAMLSVALVDVAAVALIRAEASANIPAVTLLAIFPMLWLAYGFGTVGIICAVAGTGVITSLTYLIEWRYPTPAEWVDVAVLPILVSGVAIAVHFAARTLARTARTARAANARLELARQEAVDQALLLSSILDNMHAGVGYYDASNHLVLANRRAREMSEQVRIGVDEHPYRGEHVLGPDRATVIPPEERIIARALRGEEVTDEMEWLGAPDAQIAVTASSRRIRRDDGEFIGTVIITHEITEMALSAALREEFLKTVSHELRTPVTNIAGYAELIGDSIGDTDAELRRSLDAVQRNVDKLTERLRELLTAADTAESMHLAEIDVRPIVREAFRSARARADAVGITLELLDLPDTVVRAHAQPERLRDAVLELISNAVKHGPPSGAVTIGLTSSDGRLRISVADTGRGITRAEQSRIFDKFYRTDKARRDAVQGFGLGLTLVQNVVRAHGGKVLIDSGTGAGTRFTIDLPSAA